MKVPQDFLDFSKINSIQDSRLGIILYRAEDALKRDQASVQIGNTAQSAKYHRDKLINTFGQFHVQTVFKRRKGEAGVPAHHYYDPEGNAVPANPSAPPGTYVEKRLLYRLLAMSNLQSNQRLMEEFETTVLPSIFQDGWFVCSGLSQPQLLRLKDKVETLIGA